MNEQPTTKHTEGELKVTEFVINSVTGHAEALIAGHDFVMAYVLPVLPNGQPDKERLRMGRANLAHLALCWNSHADLVAALTLVSDLQQMAFEAQGCAGSDLLTRRRANKRLADAEKAIRSALAKAGGAA